MDSYGVKIVLCVEGIDLRSGETYYLSLNNDSLDMPQRDMVYNKNINSLLSDIISEYINLDFSWVSPKLISTHEEHDIIYLIYKSLIPYDTELENSCWVPIQKSINNRLISHISKVT